MLIQGQSFDENDRSRLRGSALLDAGEMSGFDAPRARQLLPSEDICWLERNTPLSRHSPLTFGLSSFTPVVMKIDGTCAVLADGHPVSTADDCDRVLTATRRLPSYRS